MPDLWSSIGDADALGQRNVFVAEGRRVIQRVLAGAAGGPDAIMAALATPAAAAALDLEARVGDRLRLVPPAEMQALTGFNFHRGALAIVRRPAPRAIADVIAAGQGAIRDTPGGAAPGRAPVRGRGAVYVVGERIADADNVGSLFRNALAFGADAVILDDKSADPLYRKSVRTSLGAVLTVPWAQTPLPQLFAALHESRVVTVGLTPAVDVPTLRHVVESAAARPLALVLGNEGEGLSKDARQACTWLAHIPMAAGADSLNVAAALAVALYELTR